MLNHLYNQSLFLLELLVETVTLSYGFTSYYFLIILKVFLIKVLDLVHAPKCLIPLTNVLSMDPDDFLKLSARVLMFQMFATKIIGLFRPSQTTLPNLLFNFF